MCLRDVDAASIADAILALGFRRPKPLPDAELKEIREWTVPQAVIDKAEANMLAQNVVIGEDP